MALFGNARSIKLYLTGDSSSLERALTRSEAKLKGFERVAGRQSKLVNAGLIGGLSRGGAITAGAGIAALGLKSVADAAKNAEVILGQTSVAVEDAGLSWEKNSKRIQDASLRISKSSAFDDEQVLQSFQVFVRGQKDIGKSLQLSQLAADVARGRYTDLASATQLVNKAALGQIGALRRAGIAIDKNATSTQALDALQRAYGGSAKRYADSAAGAQDRLRVSLENLRETLGQSVTPFVADFASELANATDKANKLAESIGKITGLSGGDLAKFVTTAAKSSIPVAGPVLADKFLFDLIFGKGKKPVAADTNALAKQFSARFGLGAFPTTAGGATPSFGQPGFKVGSPNEVFRPGPSVSLRNQIFDNAIARRLDRVQDIKSRAGQISALQGIRGTLQAKIAQTKDATRRLNLGDEVVEITRQIKSLNQAIADGLKEKAQKLRDAQKKITADLKQQADDIKSAVLKDFDARTQRIENARALEDASKQLRLARQIGGPEGIKLALRDVQDAQLARQRLTLEQAQFRVTPGGPGPSANLAVAGVTIVINSNQPPEQIAKQIESILLKRAKKSSGQSRGRRPGTNPIGL